jgi:protein TonB
MKTLTTEIFRVGKFLSVFLFALALASCGGENASMEMEDEKQETSTEKMAPDESTEEAPATRKIESLEMNSSGIDETEVEEELPVPDNMVFENVFNAAEVEAMPSFEECSGKETREEKEKCFQKNLMKNIRKNITYPEDAKDLRIEGKSYIAFVVDENGMVSDTKVIRSAGHEYAQSEDAVQNIKDAYASLDAAAVEAIKETPKMSPAIQAGKPVKVQFTMPVDFKLE